MGQIKLSKEKVKNIQKRLLNGESSTSIAKYYKVSSGHIRKIRLGMQQNPPDYARWTYVECDRLRHQRNNLIKPE